MYATAAMTGSQNAQLNYLEWQPVYLKEKPYQVFSNISENDPVIDRTTNLVFRPGDPETIHDARGHEEEFDLDMEGFMFAVQETNVSDFKNRHSVEGQYLKEMEQLLRSHIRDIEQVYFFDWRVQSVVSPPRKFLSLIQCQDPKE